MQNRKRGKWKQMLFVEGTFASFVTAPSDGAADMVAMEIISQGSAGVAFIRYQTLRSKSHLTGTSVNSTLLHQSFCLSDVAFLTRCEQKSDQSARTFTTNMDLGAETTP
jgi:hypothetical protein